LHKTKLLAIFLAVMMIFGLLPSIVFARDEEPEKISEFSIVEQNTVSFAALSITPEWHDAMNGALGWLLANTPNPSAGDEWAVIAVARANMAAESWFSDYLSNLENYKHSSPAWTDLQRVTLALTALGEDASDFNGNDLLADFRNFTPASSRPVHSQGVTVDIFALIALNSQPYTGEQAQYVESILAAQTESGAWAWSGEWPSADLTAMAIQALAPYYESNTAVTDAINNGFDWIETEFLFSGEEYAQVIVALTAIGRCANDYVAGLLEFYDEETSGFFFLDWQSGEPIINAMSTEQAAYALVAHYRHVNGMNTLFDMSDAKTGTGTPIPTPTPPPSTSQTPSQPTQTRAFISVRNDSASGTKVFFEGYLNLNSNETAYTLLQRTGLTLGTRGTYVYSIDGLAELDYGPNSGWKYRVNGVFPMMGASNFTVKNNDRVEWLFTLDGGQDIGGSGSGDGNTVLPSVASDKNEDEEETPPEEEIADATEPDSINALEQEPVSETPEPETYEAWENPFEDVSDADWFYYHVKFMYERGLMTGVEQGVFAPEINLSRAMLVHILWRLEEKPFEQNGISFDDVAHGHWYSDAINWARANGIVQGFGDGTFRPNNHITKEHFAVVARNYGEFKGIIIDPATLNSLVGNSTITRAEAAAILQMLA